jgi:hypothetical protein
MRNEVMSKANVCSIPIRSRGAAAAAPTEASRAIDPIFGAIDAWRRADAARVPVDGEIPDELADKFHEAFLALIRTRPITPAGLAALTTWMREWADDLHANFSVPRGEDLCAITAAIDGATRGMSGLKPWSPPLQAASECESNNSKDTHSRHLYFEIEGGVPDLTRMARLAELQLHEAVGELQHRDGKIVEIPDTEATELAIFAVSQMAIMAKKFEELYLSSFEDDRRAR